MGNRAVIEFKGEKTGVYLHWNGGRDSVEAFLEYCKLRGFRTGDYGIARFTQVVGNFLGGGLSIGVGAVSELDCDNYDNGVYVVDNWEIVGRKYFKGREQNEYDRTAMIYAIDEAQPEKDRIGDYLKAKAVKAEQLRIGDLVCFLDWSGEVRKARIIGFGDGFVNGEDRTGKPFCNAFAPITSDGEAPEVEVYKHNPNNYRDDFKLLASPLEVAEMMKKDEAEAPKTAEISINEELKGIEIKFKSKPNEATREALKKAGFRWHSKKCVWYAKNDPDHMEKAEKILKAITD